MAIYSVHERKNAAGTKIGRGWSNALWASCPWNAIRDNPALGFTFFDDYVGSAAGDYVITAIAGSGTAALANAHGGNMVITAAAATDTHGAILNPGSTTGAFVTPSALTTIWLECLGKQTLQTVTLGSSYFGLATQAQALGTTGALNGTDYIGFHALDAATAKLVYLNAGATLYAGSTLDTVVTDEWFRWGLKIRGLRDVTPYINGVEGDTVTATTAISLPDAIMNIAAAVVSGGGTGTPTFTLDWVRFACAYDPDDVVTL